MPNPLIRRLRTVADLTAEDQQALIGLCSRSRRVEARQDIVSCGAPPRAVHLVLDGLAYRYKLMAKGDRQIVGILVPGDLCDLHVTILGKMDHAVATLTPCAVVDIPAEAVRALTEQHPRIARALHWSTLVEEGTLREWVANIAQREAPERMAHFFCELLVRLRAVGLADEGGYELPLTQSELGDTLGMTNVHVNRTLQGLREAGLIVLRRKRLDLPDVARLKTFCDFDPTYLHLEDPAPERL